MNRKKKGRSERSKGAAEVQDIAGEKIMGKKQKDTAEEQKRAARSRKE